MKQPDISDSSSAVAGQDPHQEASSVPPDPPPAVSTTPSYQLEDNRHVRRALDQFQAGDRRMVVEAWLARSGRYLPMILDVFRQKGLPEELVFTAMIESGFNPVAVSRAGAKGLWQFMAPTAKRYGLRVDRWLDERLDPEKSTMAAASHLLDLYAVFGSWNLVHAAYNAGEMKVLRAIRTMGTTDFWALTRGRLLKEETKNFVPAIHAASLIARAPERYGFSVTPEEPLRYELVEVPQATMLQRIASISSIPVVELERLNPELRLKQTPPGGTYALKVPVGGTERIQSALEREAGGRRPALLRQAELGRSTGPPPRPPTPEVHVVKPRETVDAIAKRYGVSVGEITRWNDLDEAARIFPGDRLRVAALPGGGEEQGGFR